MDKNKSKVVIKKGSRVLKEVKKVAMKVKSISLEVIVKKVSFLSLILLYKRSSSLIPYSLNNIFSMDKIQTTIQNFYRINFKKKNVNFFFGVTFSWLI